MMQWKSDNIPNRIRKPSHNTVMYITMEKSRTILIELQIIQNVSIKGICVFTGILKFLQKQNCYYATAFK